MKRTAKKSLAVLLAVITLFSCISVSVCAKSTGFEVLRVNCTMYGDSKTQRGFTWYTEDYCDTVIQVVKASDYDGTFNSAKTYIGETSVFRIIIAIRLLLQVLKRVQNTNIVLVALQKTHGAKQVNL